MDAFLHKKEIEHTKSKSKLTIITLSFNLRNYNIKKIIFLDQIKIKKIDLIVSENQIWNSRVHATTPNKQKAEFKTPTKQKAEFKTPTKQKEFQCNNDTYPSNPRFSLRL